MILYIIKKFCTNDKLGEESSEWEGFSLIDYKALGRRIRNRRLDLHFTQEKFAEKLSVSTEYVSRIETGKFHPSLGLIERIAQHMETTEQFLLFGSKDEREINRQLFLQLERLSPRKKEILMKVIELLESEE